MFDFHSWSAVYTAQVAFSSRACLQAVWLSNVLQFCFLSCYVSRNTDRYRFNHKINLKYNSGGFYGDICL